MSSIARSPPKSTVRLLGAFVGVSSEALDGRRPGRKAALLWHGREVELHGLVLQVRRERVDGLPLEVNLGLEVALEVVVFDRRQDVEAAADLLEALLVLLGPRLTL